MKEIFVKIILMIIVAITVLGLYANQTSKAFSLGEIVNMGSTFLEEGEQQNPVNDDDLSNLVIPVAQVLVIAANITITVVTAIMGIKYITGNPEEKAKLKTQLIGLVLSTVVVFGAQLIWSLLYNFFKDF